MTECFSRDLQTESVRVFLDEGALDGEARFPSACAVVVADLEHLNFQIENLIHEISLQPDFQLESAAANFEEIGFHHVDDNLLARERFKGLLPKLDFEWWCSVNLDTGLADPYDTLPAQFVWLVSRILQKYRGSSVHFVFEQNHRLRNQFRVIIDSSVTLTRTVPDLVTFSIGSKSDRALSIADYCIAVASQAIRVWAEACCESQTLARKYQYRSFASIEPLCSTLFAANLRKSISNRATRLADRTFFEVAQFHWPSCHRSSKS